MITYIDPHITVEQLFQEMKDICRFPQDQVFTMKWVDEEGESNVSLLERPPVVRTLDSFPSL
jgi:hypothetical protein